MRGLVTMWEGLESVHAHADSTVRLSCLLRCVCYWYSLCALTLSCCLHPEIVDLVHRS